MSEEPGQVVVIVPMEPRRQRLADRIIGQQPLACRRLMHQGLPVHEAWKLSIKRALARIERVRNA